MTLIRVRLRSLGCSLAMSILVACSGGSARSSSSDAAPTSPAGARLVVSPPPTEFLIAAAHTLRIHVSNTGTGDLTWSASSPSTGASITSGATGRNGGDVLVSVEENRGAARTIEIAIDAGTASGSPVRVQFSQSAALTRTSNSSWKEGPIGFGTFSPAGDLFYPWNYSVVATPIRLGTTAERFEVRNGDCATHFDGCARNVERVELTQGIPRQGEGDEYWYGWSFMIPDESGDNMQYSWTGQFIQCVRCGTGLDDWRPFFMFERDYTEGILRGVVDPTRPGTAWASGPNFPLISANDLKQRWHDVVVHAKWAHTNGFFYVWVNDRPRVSYEGSTMFDGASADYIYFKYGIYRVKAKLTQVTYFDEIRRGKTRAEVDIRMLDTLH